MRKESHLKKKTCLKFSKRDNSLTYSYLKYFLLLRFLFQILSNNAETTLNSAESKSVMTINIIGM